jgi:predicted O-linked N-acetylglucosamine transferase (SPINDLY family)
VDLRPVLDALRRGDARAAVARCEALLSSGPDHVQIRTLLARGQLALGDAQAARAALDAALALDRSFAPTWIELAQLAHRERRLDEAAAALREATRLAPQMAALWLDRGETELALGHAQAAEASFATAQRLAPTERRALEGLARCAEALGRLDAEIWARQQLAALSPGNPGLRAELGDALRRDDRNDEAQAEFATALALGASDPLVAWMHWQTLPIVHSSSDAVDAAARRWDRGLAAMEDLVAKPLPTERAAALLASTTNFYRHYLDEDLVDVQRRYGAVLRRLAERVVPGAGEVPRRPRRARRRVGFVSSHLHEHTVAKIFGAWMTRLDRARFETCVFHLDAREDAVTRRLRESADRFVMNAGGLPEWLGVLRGAELDALIHLDVAMHPLSQALAAFRFAPVQAATWGHPITTGLDTIDAYLTSDPQEPADGAAHYTEELVRFPRVGATFPRPAGASDFRVALPAGAKGYLFCPQSAQKLHPRHDAIFARVAAACPEHPIVLVPHNKWHVTDALTARLQAAFQQAGLPFERHVIVYNGLRFPDFLAVARGATAMIDSFGWSGCTTTLETLAYGVPVVTTPGRTFRSNHTTGMLRVIAMDELVRPDVDAYVATIAAIAAEPERHAALRQRIEERNAVLYDDPGSVAALAEWLERALEPG